MEEPARQIQSYVHAYSDLDNEGWADSRFYTGFWWVGDALVPSLRRHVARQIRDFLRKPNLLNDASADVSVGMLGVLAATVLPLEAKPRSGGRMMLDVVKMTKAAVEVVGKERRPVAGRPATSIMTPLLAATLGPSRCVAAGRMDLEVLVWRCRVRLPNGLVSFLKCLLTSRMLVAAGSLLMIGRSSRN